jgi:hypothetical protein
MNPFWKAALWAACLSLASLRCGPGAAQVSYVDCVVNATGCSSYLQNGPTPMYPLVIAAGYRAPGDQGGGEFSSLACTLSTTGKLTSLSPTITQVTSTAGIYAEAPLLLGTYYKQEINPIAGKIASSTYVQSVSAANSTITMSQNAISGGTPLTITFTNSDNGGTIIQDSNLKCYYRTNYRGDPHEWGAYGANGFYDDTAALYKWLGWSPGPWNAIVPSNYQITSPLTCPSDTTVLAPANQAGQSNPPVRIFASGSGFASGTALIDAQGSCRLSGIVIDANNTAPYGIDVQGGKVTVDGFSVIENAAQYNINCGSYAQVSGLEVKDTQIKKGYSANVYIPASCANVRLVGDDITEAGNHGSGDPNARGVVFGSDDLTVASGTIQQSNGIGLDLTGATRASVSGMYFDSNGTYNGASAIVLGNKADTISICGNHIHRSGYNNGNATGTSQILFSGTVNNVSFCGNSYAPAGSPSDNCGSGTYPPCWPQYVYDAPSPTTLTNASFYENPEPQGLGVLSPTAAAALAFAQVLPAPRSFLTGLTLSTDITTATQTVSIASGAATDSTGVSLIQIPAIGCSVNLGGSGLRGLDTSSVSPITTYFFFVVADQSPPPSGAGASPSCIASAGLSPTFGSYYGHPIYRLVGTLYTDSSSDVVHFTQNGDTFYLTASVTDIKTGTSPTCASSIGTSAISCPLSVPCGHNAACTSVPPLGFPVEAFGRIVGGGGGTGTNQLLLSSFDQADQTPAAFPTAPGNTNSGSGMVTTTTPPVYPFHLTTDGNGNVRTRATASGITAYEVTDGWVWHRQQ